MLTLLTFLINSAVNFALGLGVAYFLGAQEFGTFALAAAAAMVLQTIFFEWLRLSANRFYGERQGDADPGIVTTLNRLTGSIAIALSIGALGIYFGGGGLGATALVAAIAPLISITSGLFDYRAALARARFQHRRYAELVLVKNAVALVLMLGGAWIWRRADIVLFGLCLSSMAGVAASMRSGRDRDEKQTLRTDLVRQFAAYSIPIVLANIIFLANMVMVRSGVAWHHGIAESGRYSLALDIGLKLVATIGSGLDLILFQLAVKAEAEGGMAAARERLSANLATVFAVVLPTAVGIWLVLPSFEALFVSESYCGAFSEYITLLLPGLFACALIQYAINPLFQIARNTSPVMLSALVSLIVTAAVLFLVPGTDGGHGALATTSGFIAGLVTISVLAMRIAPVSMPWSDLAKALAATGGMAAAALPLRGLAPGPSTLLATAIGGAAVYATIAFALNLGGCRTLLLTRLRPAVG